MSDKDRLGEDSLVDICEAFSFAKSQKDKLKEAYATVNIIAKDATEPALSLLKKASRYLSDAIQKL